MVKKTGNLREEKDPSPKSDIFFIIDMGLVMTLILIVLWTVDKLTGGKLGL